MDDEELGKINKRLDRLEADNLAFALNNEVLADYLKWLEGRIKELERKRNYTREYINHLKADIRELKKKIKS